MSINTKLANIHGAYTQTQQGWNTQPQVRDTIKITSHYRDTYAASELALDMYIKERLVTDLVKEVYKSGYIHFEKYNDYGIMENEEYPVYKATLNVANMEFTNVFVENRVFNIDSEVFTEYEVLEALKNTYPERLI